MSAQVSATIYLKPDLPRLPPRCAEHAKYCKGCPTCRTYDRAVQKRRYRYKAYGQFTHDLIDAAPVIQALRESGVTMREIAIRSGMNERHVSFICRGGRQRLQRRTAQRLLAAIEGLAMVSSVGVARRLQALAAAGFGLRVLSPIIGIPMGTLLGLRKPITSQIHPAIHSKIAAAYEQLLGVSPGQSRTVELAMTNAKCKGWLPPEAWTDATIDDPEAEPYSDPEAAGYVDEERLRRARLPAGDPKRIAFTQLSYAEQLELYRDHTERQKRSPRAFVADFRPVKAKILRQMQADLGQEVVGRGGQTAGVRVAG